MIRNRCSTSAIDYNEFVGRMAIGRIERGALKQNQEIMVCNYHNPDAAPKKAKAVSLYEFDGLGKKPVTESTAGNIICLSGIGDITIGDTICAPECVEALPFVKISAPTMEMTFSINDSPFAGRDGMRYGPAFRSVFPGFPPFSPRNGYLQSGFQYRTDNRAERPSISLP